MTLDEQHTATRKSYRVSKKPKWQRTGEFIMQQQGTQPMQGIQHTDWITRAEYLKSVVASGVFTRMDSSDVASIMLNIVSGK